MSRANPGASYSTTPDRESVRTLSACTQWRDERPVVGKYVKVRSTLKGRQNSIESLETNTLLLLLLDRIKVELNQRSVQTGIRLPGFASVRILPPGSSSFICQFATQSDSDQSRRKNSLLSFEHLFNPHFAFPNSGHLHAIGVTSPPLRSRFHCSRDRTALIQVRAVMGILELDPTAAPTQAADDLNQRSVVTADWYYLTTDHYIHRKLHMGPSDIPWSERRR